MSLRYVTKINNAFIRAPSGKANNNGPKPHPGSPDSDEEKQANRILWVYEYISTAKK